ncbi:tetratricopeptide repeat protein [Paenibacillus tundrae]|uniref:tetratricopeptide repeat protein n=1 Tax=Paenibacillus tundrae TaxID=528187 RepID=UPI0030CEA984
MEFPKQQMDILLEEKNFDEMERLLLDMLKKDHFNSDVNYYLGLMYSNYYNSNKSEEKAKEFFLNVISSEYVYEYAYIYLERKERNKNKSIRLLEAGLKVFPHSAELNERLLIQLEGDSKEGFYKRLISAGISTNEINSYMMNYYYDNQKYNEAIEASKSILKKTDMEILFIRLHNAYCFYKLDEIGEAIKYLENLINMDIKHDLNYAQHVGLILCYLHEDNNEKAFEIFGEIPEDYEIGLDIILYPHFSFSFEKEFNETVFKLEQLNNDKLVLAKLKGLRGLSRLSNENSKADEKKIIKDLGFAQKYLKNNLTYTQKLKEFAEESNKNLEAFKLAIYTIRHGYEKYKEDLENEYYWDFINNCREDEIIGMKESLIQVLRGAAYLKNDFSGEVITQLIERLYDFKKFKDITEIAEELGYKKLNKYILFEVAYSYSKIDEIEISKQYYEKYEAENGKSNASSNNIGVILRKEGLLFEAQQRFKIAVELDPKDKTALENYKSTTKMISEREHEQEVLRKAAQQFSNENAWIKGKLLSFSKYQDNEGFIICSYKKLPYFLNVSEIKANELLKSFLENKYLFKITDHNLNTTSSVYRINSEIAFILIDLEKEGEKESDLIGIAESITLNSFRNLGFDEKLISALDKISNPDLRAMLERDLNENILSLSTKSFKSALILSGSIIEAVLLDHISAKDITQYTMENGRNKKVAQMDLNELLYISNQENFIDIQLYYLSHAIRGFRNLIHPGVEQRKRSVVVNEENAMLAWSIVKKVILEI